MFTEMMSISAKLMKGLGLTIVGMGVVFGALTLISLALDLLRIGCAAPVKKVLPDAGRPPERRLNGAEAAPQKDPGELIAVISAAVAAHTRRDGFIVRSIRPRREGASLWRLAGRQQQMRNTLHIQVKRGTTE